MRLDNFDACIYALGINSNLTKVRLDIMITAVLSVVAVVLTQKREDDRDYCECFG